MEGIHGSIGPTGQIQAAPATTFQRAPRSRTPVVNAGTKPEFAIDKLSRDHDLERVRLCQRDTQRLAEKVRVDEPASGLRQDLRGARRQSCCRLLRADDGLGTQARKPAANREGLSQSSDRRCAPGKTGCGSVPARERTWQSSAVRCTVTDRRSRRHRWRASGARSFHAIDEAARHFYLHFEFEESPVDPYQLLLLLKDLRKAIHEGA